MHVHLEVNDEWDLPGSVVAKLNTANSSWRKPTNEGRYWQDWRVSVCGDCKQHANSLDSSIIKRLISYLYTYHSLIFRTSYVYITLTNLDSVKRWISKHAECQNTQLWSIHTTTLLFLRFSQVTTGREERSQATRASISISSQCVWPRAESVRTLSCCYICTGTYSSRHGISCV